MPAWQLIPWGVPPLFTATSVFPILALGYAAPHFLLCCPPTCCGHSTSSPSLAHCSSSLRGLLSMQLFSPSRQSVGAGNISHLCPVDSGRCPPQHPLPSVNWAEGCSISESPPSSAQHKSAPSFWSSLKRGKADTLTSYERRFPNTTAWEGVPSCPGSKPVTQAPSCRLV